MKAPQLLLTVVLVAATAAVTWRLARPSPSSSHAAHNGNSPNSPAAKPLYYQSAMHPWIRSDRPGNCTICGMALTPVYSGDQNLDLPAGTVSLASNSLNVLHVETAVAARQDLVRTLRVAGTIEDDDTRHKFVSAYVDGRIDQLHVNFLGAEVREHEPLALLYSPTLLTAEREYLALRRHPSTDPAFQADHQPLLEAAAFRLRRLGLAAPQIDALPDKPTNSVHSEILAPHSGTVVARFAYEGQYVREGDKLFEVADFTVMWFQFDAYEQDLAWLTPGLEVDVTTPANPGKVYRAPIAFIDPNLNPATRTARVRVEIPNPLRADSLTPKRELYHRLYAEGRVQLRLPNVLALPRSAILSPGNQPVVYIDRGGGIYEQRAVQLGRHGDSHREILAGVEPGERVVVSGNLMIDAQAQLNLNAQAGPSATSHDHSTQPQARPTPTPTPTPASASPSNALEPAQLQALQGLITAADQIGAALAADKLDAFNTAIAALPPALGTLTKAVPDSHPWHRQLQSLAGSPSLGAAASLTAARSQFEPIARALAPIALEARSHPAFTNLHVFRCPMTARSFPNAPKSAVWIQLGTPIRNPYFGAVMIDCGTEVQR